MNNFTKPFKVSKGRMSQAAKAEEAPAKAGGKIPKWKLQSM